MKYLSEIDHVLIADKNHVFEKLSTPPASPIVGQVYFNTVLNKLGIRNATTWVYLDIQGTGIGSVIGDFKSGYQTADHSGWIKLDGRLKTTLTATQQTQATNLGIGANLPNIADRTVVGVSGSKALNTSAGSATITIVQNQLPNVVPIFTGTAHTHTTTISNWNSNLSAAGTERYYGVNGANTIGSNATTSSSVVAGGTISSINGNVAQQAINVQNPYLALNGFIYLGL